MVSLVQVNASGGLDQAVAMEERGGAGLGPPCYQMPTEQVWLWAGPSPAAGPQGHEGAAPHRAGGPVLCLLLG